MGNSLFKQLGSVFSTAINTEATTRQTADSQLQSNINTEATARQTADTTLTNSISVLDAAYKAADTTLTTNLTALTNTVSALDTAYKAADTALTTALAGKLSTTGLKTINGTSLVGAGDITISSGGGSNGSIGLISILKTDYIDLGQYFPEVHWTSTNTQSYGWVIQRTDGVANGVAQFALVSGGYRPTAQGGCKATVLPFQVNADNTITVGSATTLWTNGSSPSDFSTCTLVTDSKSGSFHYSGTIPWPGSSHTMNYGTAILNANNTATNIYNGTSADQSQGIHNTNGQFQGLPDGDGSGWLGCAAGYANNDSRSRIHSLDFRNPSSPIVSVQNPGANTSTTSYMQLVLQSDSTTSNTAISGAAHWTPDGNVRARVFAGNSTTYTDYNSSSGWDGYRSNQFWGVALSTGSVLVFHGSNTFLYSAHNSRSDVTSQAGSSPSFTNAGDVNFGGRCIVPDGVDSWLMIHPSQQGIIFSKWSINPSTYKWTKNWGGQLVNFEGMSYNKLFKLPNNRLLIVTRGNPYNLSYYTIIDRSALPA